MSGGKKALSTAISAATSSAPTGPSMLTPGTINAAT